MSARAGKAGTATSVQALDGDVRAAHNCRPAECKGIGTHDAPCCVTHERGQPFRVPVLRPAVEAERATATVPRMGAR